MPDKRKNNGGHSTKGRAGRKPKEDEQRIRGLCIDALVNIHGSEEKAFEFIAEQAKEGGKTGFPYLKLLFEYAYGKPKETIDLNHDLPKPMRKHFRDFNQPNN